MNIPTSYTVTPFRQSAPPNAFFNIGSSYTVEPAPAWMKSLNPKKANEELDKAVTEEFVQEGPPNQMDLWRLNDAAVAQEKRVARGILSGPAPKGLHKERVRRSKGTKVASVQVKRAKRAVGSKKKTTKKKNTKKSDKKKTVKKNKPKKVVKKKKKSEASDIEDGLDNMSTVPELAPDNDYLF